MTPTNPTNEIKVSNLTTNEDLALKFQESAYHAVKNLKKKYYTMFLSVTEDDIVQEVWVKVLKYGISYDKERNPNFEAFVYMITNSVCLDYVKFTNKKSAIPVLSQIPYDTAICEDNFKVSLEEYIYSQSVHKEVNHDSTQKMLDNHSVTDTFGKCYIDNIPLTVLINLKNYGYSNTEISSMVGIERAKIALVLKKIKEVYRKRLYADGYTLEDILFNEEINYFHTHDKKEFISSLSCYKDQKHGMKLSDIVRYVLADKSYRYIGEKLKVKSTYVEEFLTSQLCNIF